MRKYVYRDLEKTDLDDLLYRDILNWRDDFDPNINIDPRKHRFLISVDIAEGKDEAEQKDNDYTVLNIHQLELKSLAKLRKIRPDERYIENMFRIHQVGIYRDNIQDETEAAKVCQSIVFDQFESVDETIVKMVIEMNFNGKAFLNKFTDHKDYFEDIVMKSHHTSPVPGQKEPPKKAGFKVRRDKDYFCRLGKKMIDQKTLIPNEEKTYNEFGSFGKVKGKWKGIASHDDIAMSELNIARIYEEKDEYRVWLEDFLDVLPDSPEKRYAAQLLNEVVGEDDVDDETWSALYSDETSYENNAMKEIFERNNLPWNQ